MELASAMLPGSITGEGHLSAYFFSDRRTTPAQGTCAVEISPLVVLFLNVLLLVPPYKMALSRKDDWP